jgi:hypothetical protein
MTRNEFIQRMILAFASNFKPNGDWVDAAEYYASKLEQHYEGDFWDTPEVFVDDDDNDASEDEED